LISPKIKLPPKPGGISPDANEETVTTQTVAKPKHERAKKARIRV
jgi:hypothetical protein